MAPERTLEGWAPVIGQGITLGEVVDLAFDYRGDVTLHLVDGTSLVGYLFNRDRDVPEPYVQVVAADGITRTVPYAAIGRILFTGKDTAAGKSYEAWKERRVAEKATKRV